MVYSFQRKDSFLFVAQILILFSLQFFTLRAANVFFSRGDLTVFAQTTYIFQIEIDKSIPAGEKLSIKFSNGYTLPSGAFTTCLLNNNTLTGCTCSGLECIVPLPQLTAPQSLALEIGPVTNPSEVVTITFTLTSTTLGTNTITGKRLDEAPIRIESAIVEKPKVQELTSYTIRFKLTHAIPVGGKLTVKFPSTSTDMILPSTDTVIMSYDYDGSTTTYPAITEDDEKVGITEPFITSGYTRPDSFITMTINNIENPQSVGQSGEIELRTLSKALRGINRGVFRVNITQAGTALFQAASITGSRIINQVTSFEFSFRFDISFVDTSTGPYFYISVVLPTGFVVQDSVFCTLSGGLVNPNMAGLFPQCRKADDSTVLLAFVIYNSPNSPTTLGMTGIKNPLSTRQVTNPVNITVLQSSTSALQSPRLIAAGTYDWAYAANPANLTINGITRNTTVLGRPVVITFNFILPDPLEQGARLIIEIPSDQVAFSGIPVCERDINGLNLNMACVRQEDGNINRITLSLCQTASVCTSGTNVILRIRDNTFNPRYIRLSQVDSVRMYTKTADNAAFYHSNTQNLMVTPSLTPMIPTDIQFLKIGPESQVVNKPFMFSITFTPNSNILNGGYIFLYFPTEAVYPESDSLVACSYSDNNGISNTDSCIIKQNSTASYIQTIGMLVCKDLSNPCVPPLTFTITGLKNPKTTQPIPRSDSNNYWALESGLSQTQRIDFKVLTTELPDINVVPNNFIIDSFNIDDLTTGKQSTATLQFTVATPIPSVDVLNSRIIITAPQEISLLPTVNNSCQVTLLPDTPLTCMQNSSVSPNYLVITQTTPNSEIPESSQIQVVLKIRNPYNTRTTSSFGMKSVSNVNSVDYPLDTYIENNLNLKTVPNTFTGFSLKVDPPTVGSKAVNTFQFTPSTSIPPASQFNSRILIQLPSTMVILKMSNPPLCTATAQSITLSCTYKIIESPQSIVLSHTQSSLALGNLPITVVVPSGVLQSPGSTKPTDPIILRSVSTIEDKDYSIDELNSGFINDQVNQPAPITNFYASKNNSRTSKYTELTLSFVPVNPLAADSLIAVTLPKEQILLSSTLTNLQAFYQTKSAPLVSSQENATHIDFTLRNPCNPCPENISIVLRGLINPPEAIIFKESLQLYTKTADGAFLIDAVTQDFFTFPKLTSGSLANLTFTSSSWVVGTPTDLILSFNSNTALSPQATLHISFSDELYFDAGSGVSCKNALNKPASPLMCVYNTGTSLYPNPVSDIEVLLSTLCKSTCPQGTVFSIMLQGLKNAFSQIPIQTTITVTTFEGDMPIDSNVLKNSSALFPGNLAVLQLERSSKLVGTVTDVFISVKTSTLIISQSKLVIDLSKSNQLVLDPNASISCSESTSLTQKLRNLPCSSTGNSILTISDLCVTETCPEASTFSFTIKGVKNVDFVKPSLTPEDSPKIMTIDEKGYVTDQISQGLKVTPALTISTLTLVSSSVSSRVVSTQADWNLKIRIATALRANSNITIELPVRALYKKSGSLICTVGSSTAIKCGASMFDDVSLGIQRIQLSGMCNPDCEANTILELEIQGIVNPPVVYEDSNQITITSLNLDSNRNPQMADTFAGTWLSMLGKLIPGDITIMSMAANLPYPGILTNLTIIFANTHPIVANSQVIITLPDLFIVPDFIEEENKCQGIVGFSESLQCKKQGNQLILLNGFAESQGPSVFGFDLVNILNPKNPPLVSGQLALSGFVLAVRNQEGLLTDISSTFGYTLTTLNKRIDCSDNCQTCTNTSTTCTSCYVPSQFPLLVNGTCSSSCPSGYIMGEGKCIPCYPGCSSCTGPGQNQCVSCKTPQFLLDGKCVTECPPTTTLDTNLNACVSTENCTNNCANCSETPSFCLTCLPSKVLDVITHSCIDPTTTPCSSQYYYDSSSKKCLPCDSKCGSCTSSPTQCTSCSSLFGSFLDTTQLPNICRTQCPTSTYSDFNNKCLPCSPTCLTCSGPASTQCTSCDVNSENPLLQYGQCLRTCSPNYMFDNELNQCILPCTDKSCFKCEEANLNICLTCKDGFLLDENQCKPFDTCPQGQFFSVQKKACESCNPSCATCSGSAITCTSCKTNYNPPITVNPGSLEFLYGNQCLQACPLGYSGDFSENKKCEKYDCSAPCEFCSGSPTKCFTCLSSYPYKYQEYCYTSCPQGTNPVQDKVYGGYLCISTNTSVEPEPNKTSATTIIPERSEVSAVIVALVILTSLSIVFLLGVNIVSMVKKFPISNIDAIVVIMQILEFLSKCMLIPNLWGQEDGFLFFTLFTLFFNIFIGINFNALYFPLFEKNSNVKSYMQLNNKLGKATKVLTYASGPHMIKTIKSGITGKPEQFENVNHFQEVQFKHNRMALLATMTQAFIDILILSIISKKRDAFGIAVFNFVYNLVICFCFLCEALKKRFSFKKLNFLRKDGNQAQIPAQKNQ